MPLRSMTGFAQVRCDSGNGQLAFIVSLKSVNHRYLDLQFRLPSEFEALEMKLRRLLKERLGRGHVDLTLSVEKGGTGAFQLNRELVSGYVQAFRQAAAEYGVSGEPDLNALFRLPGALASAGPVDEGFENEVLARTEEAIQRLNQMRLKEGKEIEGELAQRMKALAAATAEVEKLRGAVTRAYLEKVRARMSELLGGKFESERILQEAAMLAERSDIQEELVRMKTHVQHFVGLLKGEGEAGKKLDFLLQEMNREANTLLSKTAGVAGEGLRITELGLAMKAEIEKAREQVQNVE